MAKSIDEAQLMKRLGKERYRILRQAGTEPAFSGEFVNQKHPGLFVCGTCGSELFRSDHKFDSGSGWPSFYDVASRGAVRLVEDHSHGMQRLEVRCAECDSHLGHVFHDAPDQPTGMRFCINSLALDFQPQKPQKSKEGA